MIPPIGDPFLFEQLETGPEKVRKALLDWRRASLDREQKEALLYLEFRGEDKERTASDIKALVNRDGERYKAKLNEAVCESEYEKVYESLMCAKKMADLRVAM